MLVRSTLLLASLLSLGLAAQDHAHTDRCKAHDLSVAHLAAQGLPTDLRHMLPSVAEGQRGGGSLVIPVVFHVVWNTSAENIPASAIQAVVDQMNQDYSASNSNIGSVRAPFQGVVGDVGIEFCLAQVDPSGNPTTGITRTQTTATWFNPDTQTDAMKSPPLGRSPWDPTRYLNIWVCDIHSGASGGGITLGYAYLPVGGIVGSSIDGIVIDYQFGMSISSRTATHEAGHYLGLLHTWGQDPGACSVDDGFSDTPNTDSPTFSCSNSNLQKCGNLTQYENFMDYSNCSAMFSVQQGNYMRGILNGARSSLLSSPGCAGGPVGGHCIPTSTNGTSDGDFVNSVQLGEIENLNSGGVGQPTYTDFSGTWSTELVRGETYSITIQGGTYSPDHYAAWIDYDQDEIFEANEKLGEFTTTGSGQTQSISFDVPALATVGSTRLRVRGVYHNEGEPNPTDPCFAYAWGETEDYGITILAPQTGYCIPTSTNGTSDGDFVNSVQLGAIQNLNSGGVGQPTYTNFSSTWSTDLVQGDTYTITIQSGTYSPDHFAAWIDFDQDNLFEASEKLGEFTTSEAGQSQSFTFDVPPTALLGATRLRVRGVYHGNGEPVPTDPCFAYAWGETEDYGITILAPQTGYCIPTSENGTEDGDFINGVLLGDIANLNSGGVGEPTYSDLSAVWSTALGRGTTHTISIQSGTYSPDEFAVWIDYDQDNAFQADEKLGEFTTSSSGETQDITFTVPVSAALGTTQMRVRGVYHANGEPSPTDPCFAYAWGETEDYGILIQLSTSLSEGMEGDEGLHLYPNPAVDRVTVDRTGDGPADLELFDLQGRLVLAQRLAADREVFSVAGLATGSYTLRVVQEGQVRSTRLQVVSGY